MESCEFARRLQARRLNELVDDLRQYSPDRLGALEIMLKQPESKWFSVEGVAAELSVSKETVRRWIRSGKLKTVRAGRKYRISPDDLRAFLGATPPTSGDARQ